jgi:hypothetical protein
MIGRLGGHFRAVNAKLFIGDETAWWKTVGIDPSITARALWLDTHPLPSAQTPQAGAVTMLPKIFSRPLARITVDLIT